MICRAREKLEKLLPYLSFSSIDVHLQEKFNLGQFRKSRFINIACGQHILKLLDEVFVISGIDKVEVIVISLPEGRRR